jgi:hypothetical protein
MLRRLDFEVRPWTDAVTKRHEQLNQDRRIAASSAAPPFQIPKIDGSKLLRGGRVGRQMLFEVAQQQTVQMERGAGAFIDGVRAIRILHEVNGLI